MGAWRDMGDLAGMHFQPPLQSQLAPSSVIFLAYAPMQVHDPAEQSQLDALNHDFGPASGIFGWDNRIFLYSAVHQLPCGSSRVRAPTQSLGEPARPASSEQPEAPPLTRYVSLPKQRATRQRPSIMAALPRSITFISTHASSRLGLTHVRLTIGSSLVVDIVQERTGLLFCSPPLMLPTSPAVPRTCADRCSAR